jgi:hypothetical protein
MAVKDLIKLQVGQEVAWGTSVAATAKVMGVTDMSLDIVDEVHQSEAYNGTMYPSDLVAEVSQHGEGSFSMDLSYDDILYPLDNLFEQEAPAGADPYTWTYVAPTTAVLAGNNYTFEMGGTGAEYEAAGVTLTGATISGEAGGVWTGEFPFFSKTVDDGAMAVLADRAVELIRMADTVLYIDTWAGTMGTTAVAGELISFALTFETGRHLKYFNASLAPSSFGETRWTGNLELVMEYSTVTKALVDALSAPGLVQRQIRLLATSAPDTAQIDFAGTLMGGVSLFDDRDGNLTATLNFQGTYNDTDTDWLEIVVVNSIASLT